MKRDGLVLCEQPREKHDYFALMFNDFTMTYNLVTFAHLRGYITIDEMSSIMNKQSEIRQETEKEEKEREEKFIEKYGPKSQWSDEVREMFDDPLEDLE